MRKDNRQQKTEPGEQLRLCSKSGEPVGDQTGGTGERHPSGVELSSRLEKQRTLTENVLERIVDYGNLRRAYKQLRDNGGSGGIEENKIEKITQWLARQQGKPTTVISTEK